jgi:hypothetical protein
VIVTVWWLFDDKKPEYVKLYESERSLPLSKVRGLLDNLTATCLQDITLRAPAPGTAAARRLMVECFLPLDLMDRAIEALERGMPIGASHPLVVRSSERLYEPETSQLHQLWQAQWQRLQENNYYVVPCRHGLHDDHQGHDFSNEPVVVFDFVPQVRSGDVFARLYESGVPIILWPRSDEALVDIEDLLLEGTIDQLPHQLHARRSLSSIPLSLLWDDPGRIPPLHSLAAPDG